jgi:integrase
MKTRGNGRIYSRPDTRFLWCAYFLRGEEHRQSTGESDEKKAQKFLDRKLMEVGADRIGARPFVSPHQERVKIDELCDALAENYRSRGKDSKQFISNLAVVRKHFGQQRAASLTAHNVTRWINELRSQGYACATCNRYSQLLSQAFNLAIRNRVLATRPNIERLSETGNARQGFVSRTELERIVDNLPQYLQDLVLFAFLSSWRRGEILSLTWSDVEGDTIRLRAEHSKSRKARSLALEGELAELIARRQSQQQGPLVFHHGGHAITDLRKAWVTACRMAGVPDRLFHDLRRSGVRDMIRAGVAPHVAMTISGHETDSMLKRYAIISDADQRAALRRTADFRAAEQQEQRGVVSERVQ